MSRALHDYLEKHHIKQQPLTDYLSVDIRTLRHWLSRETILNDIRELKRLADLLGVEPEFLGIAPSLSIPLTSEEIDESIEHTWKLSMAEACH